MPQTCGPDWTDRPRYVDAETKLSRSSSTGGESSSPRPRPPSTPVDKHSELLHVIAQKESVCLELRSQLATHEAELLQLKRKWEVIVSRGLNVPRPSEVDRGHTSSNSQNAGTTVVLEGIKEGVQGVGRLFLGQGGAASPSPSPSPLTKPRLRPERKTSTFESPSSRLSQSSNLSTSSTASSSSGVGTVSTKRTSLSSCSSADDAGAEIAVVLQDTGATPIMSPSPVFRQPLPRDEATDAFQNASPAFSAKTLRRRSGGMVVSLESPLLLPSSTEPHSATSHDAEDHPSSKALKTTSPLAPPAIPGLGSLANVGMNTIGFGKKWEAGIVKSQKRASLFLSDIVSALSAPSPTTPSLSVNSAPSPASSTSPYTPAKPSSLSQQPSSGSLLDDSDDDTISALNFGGIMVPDKAQSNTTIQSSPVFSGSTLTRRSSRKSTGSAKAVLADDEWNW
ncbi:hypothetical protein ONZ45_g8711 [Pleurotus djamor]|nr:hypothetical protein ONZ45_g8711 [Pleurotus djamor]